MFSKEPKLFTDPNIQYPIDDFDLSFSDYISQCKKLISNTRIDLTDNRANHIIDANAPFELRPNHGNPTKYGALLIHGLFDSPFHLRDIGLDLQKQGILVRSVLLPGHGTVPGALLNVDYHQWLQTVRYGIASLSKEVDQLLLVGNSTGASLALYLGAIEKANIAGIISLSPALKIRSIFAPYANGYRVFNGIWKRAAWLRISPNEPNDYVKYLSIPFNAVYQVYRLSQEINKQLPSSEPHCPIFFALSQSDKIICPEVILQFFEKHTHPKSRLILYSAQNINLEDSRIQNRTSVYPDMHIVNFSHICIPFAPDNTHYGINGDYYNASHVNESSNTIYGEFTYLDKKQDELLFRLNLTKTHRERLTFNPDFSYLSQAIKQFIENLQ